ncbi:MAG: hypothetical protein JWR61_3795 [Ferruginibacter sp.]|uniref:Ig-like domain-containing protein n=1 Tax=Ferruginibacter sp. TaxID=1940288 RepID=UPI00265A6933|nr:hypothetical protein [Ferruginibacter sp.]MDB5278840.1 hypothetical protein [Ferruginibacter sp.]
MKKIKPFEKRKKQLLFSLMTLLFINSFFPLTTVQAQSDAGGSYSLKWVAADPAMNTGPYQPTYQKLAPALLSCSTPSGGIGRANNPLPDAVAYAAPPLSSNFDAVPSLAPKDMALCQVVPFFIEVDVTGPTSLGVININPEWLAKTTSGDDFGFDPAYGVYCAFVDYGDPGTNDPGANAKVDSYSATTLDAGGSNERIHGTIQVSGLEQGDKVIVEIWVVLKCSIPVGSSGNVQTALIDAHTGAVGDGGDGINTGNQTVPLLKVQSFFTAQADISVTKTAKPVCLGDNVSYTISIKNNETSTVANGIVATDVLGANQTFVSASGAPTSQTGQTTVFNVGALSPQQSVTLTVVATPTVSGSVSNAVSVTEITDDPDLTNNSANASTTVYELPTCTITGEGSITSGGSVQWCAADGMSSYSWTGPNGFTSADQCVNVSDEGDYYVTITNANGCKSTCSKHLGVDPCTLTVSVNSPVICNGESATLTATNNGANSSYLWSNGETTKSITVSPTSTTDYTVTVKDGTCTVTDTKGTVTVNDKPTKPNITGGPTTFCTGGSVELSSSSATGNQWYKDGIKIDGATGQKYTATTSGVYTVTVTNDAGCSATSDGITVKVNDTPAKPTISSGATTFCAGGSVILSSSSATGNQWYKDGVKIDGATGQKYTATTSGVYTVTVTNDAGCSATSDETTVTVNPVPSCTISNITSPGSSSAGVGQAVKLSGPSGANFAYLWSFTSNTAGASFAGGLTTAATQTVTVTTTTTGSYMVSLKVIDNTYTTNCNATCSYSVSINAANGYYTVTQGFYGNLGGKVTLPSCSVYTSGGKGNTASLIALSINNMPGKQLKLGVAANNRTFTVGTLNVGPSQPEINNLVSDMPAGQAAAVITANSGSNNNTNITTNLPKLFNKKISSVLLGQTITLTLNTNFILNDPLLGLILKPGYLTTQKADFSKCPTVKVIACSADATSISSLQLSSSAGFTAWINSGTKTVGDLLNLASNALGGAALPSGVTLSDINNAVDVINRSFDGGRFFLGYYNNPTSCGSPLARSAEVMIAAEDRQAVTALTATAWPNPFTDKVKFSIVSPVSGKATLDVYNMMGQKVKTVFAGYLFANRTQVVDYNTPSSNKGALIYTLRVGDKQVNGKLVQIK